LSSFQPLRAGRACHSHAFAYYLASDRWDFFPAHDACALQMTRKRRSESQKEIAAQATLAATAKREAKRAKLTSEASSVAAPVDSGTDPPPAGRFRRSCRTPTAQVPSGRPLRLLPLLRTARRGLVEAMSQYVCQPHPPGSHAHAPQLSPSRCVQ
jgi:hypothetical protein